MSMRYPGGILSSTQPPLNSKTSSGIWTPEQALSRIGAAAWPGVSTYVGSSLVSFSPSASFSTYTFSGVSLGGNGTTKVVAVVYDGAGGVQTIASATIGGVSATVYQVFYAGSWGQAAILVAKGVSATSGNIVLNFSGALNTYGSPYFATISVSVFNTTRTNVDPLQNSMVVSNPTVTANGNNRYAGLTIAVFYSTNSSSTPGLVIDANANLVTNYSQSVAYSTGSPPAYDQYSAYSGVTSSAFTISAGAAAYQTLSCLTLY